MCGLEDVWLLFEVCFALNPNCVVSVVVVAVLEVVLLLSGVCL